jgi:hypothetical protein
MGFGSAIHSGKQVTQGLTRHSAAVERTFRRSHVCSMPPRLGTSTHLIHATAIELTPRRFLMLLHGASVDGATRYTKSRTATFSDSRSIGIRLRTEFRSLSPSTTAI